MEVDRCRLIWELLARPCLEHASEVWWAGGKVACKNLENIQENIGRKQLGGTSTVAWVAVREDLGWRKLEERRDENKLLFGWRLKTLSEDRLVRKVVALLNDYQDWWAGYCELKIKFGKDGEL